MPKQLSQDIVDQILHYKYQYGDQVSSNTIAEELGVSNNAVRRVLEEHDMLTPSKRGSDAWEDRFDPALVEFLTERYYEGEAMDQYLLDNNLTHGMWYGYLKRKNLTPRRLKVEHIQGRKAQLDHAVRMYKAGYQYWIIEKETGVRQPTLSKELRMRNVPMRGKGKAGNA